MELNEQKEKAARFEAKLSVRVETVTVAEAAPEAPSLEVRRAMQEEPAGEPVMYQTWRNLLFLHWEWDAGEIQSTLPPGLYVDTHGGKAYVAVTPFFMNDVRASFLPEIPGTSDFLELNVRTYVYDRRRVPGVWFYSLDCDSRLVVNLAKFFYSLPYKKAAMSARERGGLVEYCTHREGAREPAEFHYRREDKQVGVQPGSLPFFLAERYLLYAYSPGKQKLYTARIHHAPWQLFQAHLGRYDETMLRLNHFNPKLRPPDHRWMAEPLRVKIYGLQEAAN